MAKKSVSSSTYYKSSNMTGPGSTEYRNPRGVMTVGDKSSLPESVHQRMMRANAAATQRATAGKLGKTRGLTPAAAAIDIRGYFGDERTGIRKNVGPLNAVAPKAKAIVNAAPAKAKTPPAVVSTTTNMKLSPVKTAAPARMGGLGVTTGKTTGTTATRAGTGGKTTMSSYGRAQQTAANKGGVAGPAKNSSGRNVSSASGKRK
jgi:hypothetical protein